MNIEKKDLDQIDFLIKEKRFKDALGIFDKIKTLNSYKAKYLKVLALEGIDKFQEAIDILKELHKKNPENLNVVIKIATISEELELYDQAKEFYERILFLDPFNKEAKEKIEILNDPVKLKKLQEQKKEDVPGLPEETEEIEEPKETEEKIKITKEKQEIAFEKIDIGDEFNKKIEINKNGFDEGQDGQENLENLKADEKEKPEVEVKKQNKDQQGPEESPQEEEIKESLIEKKELQISLEPEDDKKVNEDILPKEPVINQEESPLKEDEKSEANMENGIDLKENEGILTKETITVKVDDGKKEKESKFKNLIDEDINNYFKTDYKELKKDSQDQAQDEEQNKAKEDEFGFITESAAKLYEKQNLYDEAITVYEKLEKMKDIPDLYKNEIKRLKNIRKYKKMISNLNNLKDELTKGVESV